MQYVTMKWSGQWHCVDARYSGFNGYPNLAALNGTHYAGVKPWYFKRDPKTVRKFSRYEDFRHWFSAYNGLLREYPRLLELRRLRTLRDQIAEIHSDA
jgi:glycogenin glucosyltransferase